MGIDQAASDTVTYHLVLFVTCVAGIVSSIDAGLAIMQP